MNAQRHLERLAVQAHQHGQAWSDFWRQHGAAVCEAEPHNRQRFHRLVQRLMALVVSGDDDGQYPIDAEPWRDDDDAKPADVGTQAKCQIQLGMTPPGRRVLSSGGASRGL